ncbi:MAG: hypothetical protein U5K74_00665 [Gemmatimonadaceae bacterium]|nr:hypothetical protein [Gemmatimonadaceae bacterium]
MTPAAVPAARSLPRRIALLLVLTLATVGHRRAAGQTAPERNTGWRFTWTITPTAAGQPVRNGSQVLDVAVWNGVAQIVVREGALRRMTGEHGMMLLRASDSTLLVINADRREVLAGSLADLGALMAGPGSLAPLEVTDVRSSTRDLGAGAPLLRYRTRRAQLTQRYRLRITAPGVKRELHTDQVVTIDVSRDISRLDAGFRVFADQFSRSLGLPEPVRRVLRAAERGVPSGFPVRSTTIGTTVAGTDTLRTSTRAEMTALRREPVDTTGFFAPAGFRVTEMRRLLQRPPN